jgi:hypothetical protein
MSDIWTKYKGRIIAVVSAALLALMAIFNEALTDMLSGSGDVEQPVAEAVVEEAPAEAVVEEVSE